MSEKGKSEWFDLLELSEDSNEMEIKKAYDHLVALYSKADSAEIVSLRGEISKAEREKIINDIEDAYRELLKKKEGKEEEFLSEADHQEIFLDEEETESKAPEESVPETMETVEELGFDEIIITEENGDTFPGEQDQNDIGEITSDDVELSEMVIENVSMDMASEEKQGTAEEKTVVEITGAHMKKIREEQGFKIRDVEDILGVSSKDITYVETEKFSKLTDAGYLRWLISSYARFLGLDQKKSAEDYMRRYRLKEKK